MDLKRFLLKIDYCVCRYLGIGTEQIYPSILRIRGKKLFVLSTSSYRRHLLTEDWSDFSKTSLKQANPDHIEILGVAVGKAIAKNLIVSFDTTQHCEE